VKGYAVPIGRAATLSDCEGDRSLMARKQSSAATDRELEGRIAGQKSDNRTPAQRHNRRRCGACFGSPQAPVPGWPTRESTPQTAFVFRVDMGRHAQDEASLKSNSFTTPSAVTRILPFDVARTMK